VGALPRPTQAQALLPGPRPRSAVSARRARGAGGPDPRGRDRSDPGRHRRPGPRRAPGALPAPAGRVDGDRQPARDRALRRAPAGGLISYEFAGGTVGNTLHNYSLLADDASILLGVMSETIRVGTSGYRYLSNTSSRVNLDHLQPVDGPIGRCFALVTPDGERTFAISEGKMNALAPASIPPAVFVDASALVISAYLLRCQPSDPMPDATRRAIELARAREVPVVLTLGHALRDRRAARVLARLHPRARRRRGHERGGGRGPDRRRRSAPGLRSRPRAGRPGAVHRRPDRPVPGRAHRRRGQARDPLSAPARRDPRVQPPRVQPADAAGRLRAADQGLRPHRAVSRRARAHHQHQRRRRRGAGGAAPRHGGQPLPRDPGAQLVQARPPVPDLLVDEPGVSLRQPRQLPGAGAVGAAPDPRRCRSARTASTKRPTGRADPTGGAARSGGRPGPRRRTAARSARTANTR
jgi:hypothetical protein